MLSYTELIGLIDAGVIDAPIEHVNAASIDLTLGEDLLVESMPLTGGVVDLANKDLPAMIRATIGDYGYTLDAGDFVLASTRERFNLPDHIAGEFYLKSSLARAGLEHLHAGHMDPGWHGSNLTLELKNVLQYHALRLRAGMKIGQAVFYRVTPVPDHASYAKRGQYNGDKGPTSKGVR